MSYATQLASVQAAITEIETGAQSYTIEGRTWTGADLATLYKREQWLTAKVDREANSNGGIPVRGVTISHDG